MFIQRHHVIIKLGKGNSLPVNKNRLPDGFPVQPGPAVPQRLTAFWASRLCRCLLLIQIIYLFYIILRCSLYSHSGSNCFSASSHRIDTSSLKQQSNVTLQVLSHEAPSRIRYKDVHFIKRFPTLHRKSDDSQIPKLVESSSVQFHMFF